MREPAGRGAPPLHVLPDVGALRSTRWAQASAEPLELRLEGELDAYSAPEVRAQLHALIEDSGTAGVLVVDLTRVTFMDSSILGTLVGALRRMREPAASFGSSIHHNP